METPQQTQENKKANNRVKNGLVKEPKKKYVHIIPGIGTVKSSEKDIGKVKAKYETLEQRKQKQWFETLD